MTNVIHKPPAKSPLTQECTPNSQSIICYKKMLIRMFIKIFNYSHKRVINKKIHLHIIYCKQIIHMYIADVTFPTIVIFCMKQLGSVNVFSFIKQLFTLKSTRYPLLDVSDCAF